MTGIKLSFFLWAQFLCGPDSNTWNTRRDVQVTYKQINTLHNILHLLCHSENILHTVLDRGDAWS